MPQPRRSPRAPHPRGFTLIELAVSVTIIMILALVMFGYFRNVRRNTLYQQCQANVMTLAQAQERFKANNQFYATSLDQLVNEAYGLRALPRCPAAQDAPVARTYDLGKVTIDGTEVDPGYQFKIYCTDNYHAGKVAQGYPQYNSVDRKLLPEN